MESKRQWGRTRIVGGRHAFRQAMIVRELKGRAWLPAEVLDAGCGDGSLTAALSRLGYRVSAVDASPLCVERCRQAVAWMPQGDESASRVRQSGLDALPFADGSFDACVSGEVLEHVADDAAAARELWRVLRPGGHCVVTVPADPALWGIEDEWAGHLRRYTQRQLADLFGGAGFAIVSLRRWGWPMTYIYDRFVFRRWLARRIAKGRANEEATGAEAGVWVTRLLGAGLSVDRLFVGLPFGIGFIGVWQKPK
jgi:2-polyprenyl-3-methyl-5-hydroxy-6-metoxy-1,4-benzoquinol methylase